MKDYDWTLGVDVTIKFIDLSAKLFVIVACAEYLGWA